METNAARSVLNVTAVEGLSDTEVLAGTRRLVGRSNQLLAELLAHLGEVEARGIHRLRACSSLYAYCVYELRFSEDEAFRRVAASRLVRRFPALLDTIASGELHLTGLLMLGPHLTPQNLTEVLARAKHRTKREVARLVRVLDPLPSVPARIEPLGPAPARVPAETPDTPKWETFVQSMCPVRELTPGDRPRDWVGGGEGANDAADSLSSEHSAIGSEPTSSAPARVKPSDALVPERYKVQFTATEEYVRLVEEAKALLSHSEPRASLEDIHLRAMRAFVADLRKKKYGAERKTAAPATPARVDPTPVPVETPQSRAETHPRQRGRHIPTPVRRAVGERDATRCTYVNGEGTRCAETHRLELHHLQPFAHGGEHTVSNLTLRCRAHNALAAEEEFGREHMQARQDASAHESFVRAAEAVATG